MAKVSFLLGAGASADVIPTVKDLPGSIEQVVEIIKSLPIYPDSEHIKGVGITYIRTLLIDQLLELSSNAKNHASVDTYGKKLFITDYTEKFLKFKIVLACYFILDQLRLKGEYDMRYDTFFASILGKNGSDFPSNINVLSWNYDTQFELGYMPYSRDPRLEYLSHYFQYKVRDCCQDDNLDDNFCFIKLNGSANFFSDTYHSSANVINNFGLGLNTETLKQVLTLYWCTLKQLERCETALSFAWEDVRRTDGNIIEIAKKAIANTEALVVIGYSFPFFNRQVDKEIFAAATSLKKVYIQNMEASSVIDSFSSIRADIQYVKGIEGCKQFYLPPEL